MAGSAPGAGNARSARWAALTGLLLALAALTPVVADIDIDRELIRQYLTSEGVDLTTQASGVLPVANGGTAETTVPLPAKYVEGLNTNYTSATVATVSAGSARNWDDDGNLTLAADTTLTITTTGIAGLNSRAIAGTVALTNGANALTGTSTTFLTAWPVSTITGTFTNSTTTLTGTGTKFLSELEVGDLIGDADEFEIVVTVDTDTSATIGTAPGNGAFSGAASLIHAPTIHVGGDLEKVESISSDTALVIVDVWGSQNDSSNTASICVEAAHHWYAVWLATGASGTSVFADTNRDPATLVHPSGFDVNERMIGFLRNDGALDLAFYYSYGEGRVKRYEHEDSLTNSDLIPGANPGYLVLSGVATAWTEVLVGRMAPPFSTSLLLNSVIYKGSNSTQWNAYMRPRDRGATEAHRDRFFTLATLDDGTRSNAQSIANAIGCDQQRAIDYAISGATTAAKIDILYLGYTWEAP